MKARKRVVGVEIGWWRRGMVALFVAGRLKEQVVELPSFHLLSCCYIPRCTCVVVTISLLNDKGCWLNHRVRHQTLSSLLLESS